MELFLKHGIDLNMRDNFGLSVLHVAVFTGESVEKLIHYGCVVDAVDMYGSTLLFYAITFGLFTIGKILVKAGANVKHNDKVGNAILDILRQRGEDPFGENVSQLLDEFARITSKGG